MAQLASVLTAVIAIAIVALVVQALLVVYRFIDGRYGPRGRTVDGDVIYSDDRINELLYARSPSAENEPSVDLAATETVACPECRTMNDAGYSYCRRCAAGLQEP